MAWMELLGSWSSIGAILLAVALLLVVEMSRRKMRRLIQIQFTPADGYDHLRLALPHLPRGLRVVCLSDTHNAHRDLQLPAGDVLIHAGDFTQFGKEEHASDFNDWLGEQPHKIKLVVLGNHENNSSWNSRAPEILSNATLLRQSEFELAVSDDQSLKVFGTDFFWPCPSGNPYFDQIPEDTDILIAHGPAKGCADGTKGCPALLKAVEGRHLQLVVSGHVHFARGAALMRQPDGHETVLVNAANCGSGKDERKLTRGPLVIDL
mmetsp:Transcript_62533/g.102427  ORF Transcript_62533/g.102427 Transcript_62533/m.102427 type:complete len:264 (+) Transcript_62533:50-841(+)